MALAHLRKVLQPPANDLHQEDPTRIRRAQDPRELHASIPGRRLLQRLRELHRRLPERPQQSSELQRPLPSQLARKSENIHAQTGQQIASPTHQNQRERQR